MDYPKPIQNLITIFSKFPGIGPRQATRFVFFLIKDKNGLKEALMNSLKEIEENVGFCQQCFRSMEKDPSDERTLICAFCRDPKRNPRLIAVVEKESDLSSIEKTGIYQGVYHVLGGVVSPLDPDSPKKIHLRELYNHVKNILEKQNTAEVILATSATTEGDTTALYIERILAPLKETDRAFRISRLGRGLSLGSELEYADEITLKSALTNRL